MPPKAKRGDEQDETLTCWDVAEEIAGSLNEPLWAVKNVMRLLKEENTIPFIARFTSGVICHEGDFVLFSAWAEIHTVDSRYNGSKSNRYISH